MAKIYYDADSDLSVLKNKKIAIIGYGAQGHAHALNLRDSGVDVILGLIKDPSWELAVSHGWKPVSIKEAASEADWIQMLIPDTVQAEVWEKEIKPNIRKGIVLGFAHGFNIRFKQIIPPEDADVIMIAPKGPGTMVRKMYTEGKGVPALIAVEQDNSKRAKDYALAYAKGIGATRAGVIETTFAEETETDLFGEQCILCGGLVELIKSGFQTLVDAGYQPEVAYFECLHEVKLIADLIFEGGIEYMNQKISDTAEYGEYTRGKRVIGENVRKEMQKILKEIVDGEFAREWLLESKVGSPSFYSYREQTRKLLIEKIGKELRKMMPWIRK